MNVKSYLWSRLTVVPFVVSLTCIFAVNINAAPQNIEGPIVGVESLTQTIKDNKVKYVFTGMEVVGVEVVGKNQGSDYKYKYMVVKDSTELQGIAFSDLKKDKYIRIRSRGEPPGMVGKTLDEIRPSRFGCCEYALLLDTIKTPRNITAIIKKVESPGSKERVVTVREKKTDALDFKYLILDGQTKFKSGKISDIKEPNTIEIADASVNAPLTPGKWWGELYGAHLYATTVVSISETAVAGKEIPRYNKQAGFQKVLIGHFTSGKVQGILYDIRGKRITNQTYPSSGVMLLLNRK